MYINKQENRNVSIFFFFIYPDLIFLIFGFSMKETYISRNSVSKDFKEIRIPLILETEITTVK